MVAECQQVMTVRLLGHAALDRPLVVVSQNSQFPSSRCTPFTFPSRWHESNPRTRHMPSHPEHNTSCCSSRKSCRTRPSGLNQRSKLRHGLSSCSEQDCGVIQVSCTNMKSVVRPRCVTQRPCNHTPRAIDGVGVVFAATFPFSLSFTLSLPLSSTSGATPGSVILVEKGNMWDMLCKANLYRVGQRSNDADIFSVLEPHGHGQCRLKTGVHNSKQAYDYW